MSANYQAILECFHSGQMTERQFNEHLKDPEFLEWLERPFEDDEERQYQAEAAAALDEVFDNGVR